MSLPFFTSKLPSSEKLVQGSGFRVQGSGHIVQGPWSLVQDSASPLQNQGDTLIRLRSSRTEPLSSEYGTYKTVKSRPDSGLGFQLRVLKTFRFARNRSRKSCVALGGFARAS